MGSDAEPSAGDHDGPAVTPVGSRDLGVILADRIAHADSLAAALEGVLSAVGKFCGWAQGEAWLTDEAGLSLSRGPRWSAIGPALPGIEDPDPARLVPGEGFPGRVLLAGRAVIVPEIGSSSHAAYIHRDRALAAGLQSMIGIPLAFDQHMLAVVVFNMTALTPHHEQVIATVADLAPHLFSVKRAEDAVDRANAATQRLADLLATAGDAIISIDDRHRITAFNAEAEQVFGYPAKEVIGRPLDMLLPEAARATHATSVQSFGNGADDRRLMGGRSEIGGRRKDGSEFFAEASISRLSVSDGMLFTAVLRDVTERRKVEEALKNALARAEAANVAKSEFLANMGHELRTPLNAIIGFSGLMLDRPLGPLDPAKYHEYARDIQMSGTHLMHVINDVLDLAKAEAGMAELHEETVDLPDVADECLRMIQAKADEGMIARTLAVPRTLPALRADRAKVQQILLNLLSNAVKFSRPGGAIDIGASTDAAGRFVISVRDNGIGMTPEQVPIALDPFKQVDNRLAREFQGTGLGLPIAKRLAELPGGSLEIASTFGQGTTVRIIFPATRVVQVSGGRAGSPADDLRNVDRG